MPDSVSIFKKMATTNSSSSSEMIDINKLPKQKCWETYDVYNYQGFWYPEFLLTGVLAAKSRFQARSDDIILASFPKTGTTWLKAITSSILQSDHDHLSTKNPHSVVPTLEHDLKNPETDLSTLPSPRIFHTHIPYSHLPDSIKTSGCKIVYVTRNPKDVVVSNWHFFNSSAWRDGPEKYPIEKVLDEFCEGVQFYGPFFDHVMEYWAESLKRPEKVMVLKYEDMKRDPEGEVKKVGEFVGKGVLSDGEVEEVITRTSFDRLRNLEVNKSGVVFDLQVSNSLYFRRGVVGDWKNHFSDDMNLELEDVARAKLQGSGFRFDS